MRTTIRIMAMTMYAVVILALTGGVAAARVLVPDDVFRSARLDSQPVMTVAILPAVTTVEDAQLESLVDGAWFAMYRDAGPRWVPADRVRARLSSIVDERCGLQASVHAQIWRTGSVEPSMARGLARMLDVDAVLSLRVDRWEIDDGGRAVVGLTAVMVGANGERLWSVSGCSGHGETVSSGERGYNRDLTWYRDPRLEPRTDGHNLRYAFSGLLARWAWLLPAPAADAPDLPVVVARHPAR